jgi:hypothetical protein
MFDFPVEQQERLSDESRKLRIQLIDLFCSISATEARFLGIQYDPNGKMTEVIRDIRSSKSLNVRKLHEVSEHEWKTMHVALKVSGVKKPMGVSGGKPAMKGNVKTPMGGKRLKSPKP